MYRRNDRDGPDGRGNLFEKLGKMKRNWSMGVLVLCSIGLAALGPQQVRAQEPAGPVRSAPARLAGDVGAVLAQPQIELLESRPGGTVVRVRFPATRVPVAWEALLPEAIRWWTPAERLLTDEGERLLPRGAEFTVAVPTRRDVTARVRTLTWHREPVETFDTQELLEFIPPRLSREVPLVSVRLNAEIVRGGRDGRGLGARAFGDGVVAMAEIVIEHAPAGREASLLDRARVEGETGLEKRGRGEEFLPAGLVNPAVHRLLTAGARAAATDRRKQDDDGAPDPFALTRNWVRLELDATGCYELDGNDLAMYGVALETLDPAKLRLFRGGELAIHPSPEHPDSLQARRLGLNEVAVELLGDDDGEWNLTDRLRFYGVHTITWLDRFDPAATRLDHYEHPYAARAVYWLTWEGFDVPSPFSGSPRRMAAAAPAPAADRTVTQHRARLHLEESNHDEYGWVADNWLWENSVEYSRSVSFSLADPVPDAEARFSVDIQGITRDRASIIPPRDQTYIYQAEAWFNWDANLATTSWRYNADSTRVRIVGTTTTLAPGNNVFTLRNTTAAQVDENITVKHFIGLDCIDIAYPAYLTKPSATALEFTHWADEVIADEVVRFDVQLPGPSPVTWWDVSRPDSVVAVAHTQAAQPDRSQAAVPRGPGTSSHFLVFADADVRNVRRGERVQPVPLRSSVPDADYVVVHHPSFGDAAADLAALRSQTLPGIVDPVAVAVSVQDIYDQFSGGQKDLHAVRDFLQWLYERSFGGPHPLRFVCFLGDGSRDYRNDLDHDPAVDVYDFVPTGIRTAFPANLPYANSAASPYATDDQAVSFDAPDTYLDVPDLASGRLPVRSPDAARTFVRRIRDYVQDLPEGNWRNNVVFVADDLHKGGVDNLPGEVFHTLQAEMLANDYVPASIDMEKVFMADYAFPPGDRLYKPGARTDLLHHLNDGTTLFYYVGHGSNRVLADERVFTPEDAAGLANGERTYVFVAFSCEVGEFDDPRRQSMGETMVLQSRGGSIGAITASQVSFINANNTLSNHFFANLFPGRATGRDRPLGEVLRLAKAAVFPYDRKNSQRYNLLGDPGLALPHPRDDLAFAAASVDTVRAGHAHAVRLDLAALGVAPGAEVTYDLKVDDAQEAFWYYPAPPREPTHFTWRMGRTLFRGTGPAENDELSIVFKAPLQLRTGERGRVRVIVRTPDGERAAAAYLPVVRGTAPVSDDVVGPSVQLSLENNRVRVRPGSMLSAAVEDTSGVAILGSNPGNSVLLEFDGTGFMTNVSDAFIFEPGSYARGRLDIPLPADLEPGPHSAAVYATDILGNVGADTVSFTMVLGGISGIAGTSLFPNPTPGPCRLVFELSDAMDVSWDIYTVSGRPVRSLRDSYAAGPQVIEWDGRDHAGDAIANGVYLFVLRGLGAGGGGEDIRQTGQIVIMR
ncbi:MAG: C25 family cysteine peptidase [Candidatus Krumholzibacteriia bacterium]